MQAPLSNECPFFIISDFYILFPNCFEYSCELCFDSNYGSCSVCKKNYILKDGKCECYDSNCLICTSSFRFSDCLYCKNNSLNQFLLSHLKVLDF